MISFLQKLTALVCFCCFLTACVASSKDAAIAEVHFVGLPADGVITFDDDHQELVFMWRIVNISKERIIIHDQAWRDDKGIAWGYDVGDNEVLARPVFRTFPFAWRELTPHGTAGCESWATVTIPLAGMALSGPGTLHISFSVDVYSLGSCQRARLVASEQLRLDIRE